MNNLLFFLRHAETMIDPTIKISEWELSEIGKEQAKELAHLEIFQNFNFIFSSPERKAIETIEPLAKKLGKEIMILDDLRELERDLGKYLDSREEYRKIVKMALENRDYNFNNWERASIALERFEKEIKKIDQQYQKSKILIVSHGLVLSLYFAKKRKVLNFVFDRWKKTGFCDYGIIKESKIIKDIAPLQ